MEQKRRLASPFKLFFIATLAIGVPSWGSALHLLPNQLNNFVLNADTISYLNDGKLIRASENIQLEYRGYTIYTDQFTYYEPNKLFQFRGKTVINKDSSRFTTQALDLNATLFTGSTPAFLFQSDRLYLRGQSIDLGLDTITAKSVWYSTCPFDQHSTPIYHVRSSELIIHPQRGAFVANHTVLYLWKIPIFYFPRVLYQHQPYIILDGEEGVPDTPVSGQLGKAQAEIPAPELGQNSLEGYFIRTEFGYLGRGLQSGAIRAGFSEKLGFMTGLEHRILNSVADQVKFQANWYSSLGIQGHLVYSHDTERVATTETNTLGSGFNDLFEQIISTPIIPVSQFNIRYSYRELFYNSFVTFRPKAQWILKQQALPYGALFNGTTSLSAIEETFDYTDDESRKPIQSSRWMNALRIARPYPISEQVSVDPSLSYYLSVYDYKKTWKRAFSGLRLTRRAPLYTTYIEYQEKLLNNGNSVFDFDSSNQIETDEVGLGFNTSFNQKLVYKSTVNINLESGEMRRFNHDITYFMDCISLSVGLDSVQQSYRFNVGIF